MLFFDVVLDKIWWRRNEMVFQQKWVSTKGIAVNVWALLHDIQRSKEVQFFLLSDDIIIDRDKPGK